MMLLMTGACAAESGIPSDQIWPEDRYMIRLERDVREFCDQVMRDIRPDSISLVWYDNLHPHAPMLAEAYVASMFERSLIRKGFSVSTGDDDTAYRLTLVMTPSRKSLLTLATLAQGEQVIAAGEACFLNGSEKWNQALCSYRYRTTTVIPIRSAP